ncbi:MgtC/SapB family protein [Sphingobacterium chuzhouense]|uniref:MgtC/SapB family protein n=1 Tax=Sphingobacterium chuzhouense TaxID=1742264 RepID=A0ABR7XTE0_9SPHI|nr:MgtC/SapB family protein [Sphingobacterium chuzhouense]MBD1422443.1 MgtC/SapB family protein [Sphingobacterium chuzhouense]
MFEWLEDVPIQSVLISILCGAVVGFEREFKNKSAGFRTIILICLGSTIFTLTSRMGNISDDRIAANIVTGIGFLGAGVIYQGKFTVQGLTTAAVIWSMAGVGMMIGFENYALGFVLTFCMVVILSLFQKMENLLANIYFIRTIHVTFQKIEVSHLGEFENFMKEHKVKPQRKGVEKKGEHLTVVYEITGTQKNIRRANDAIISLDYVYSFNNLG